MASSSGVWRVPPHHLSSRTAPGTSTAAALVPWLPPPILRLILILVLILLPLSRLFTPPSKPSVVEPVPYRSPPSFVSHSPRRVFLPLHPKKPPPRAAPVPTAYRVASEHWETVETSVKPLASSLVRGNGKRDEEQWNYGTLHGIPFANRTADPDVVCTTAFSVRQ